MAVASEIDRLRSMLPLATPQSGNGLFLHCPLAFVVIWSSRVSPHPPRYPGNSWRDSSTLSRRSRLRWMGH